MAAEFVLARLGEAGFWIAAWDAGMMMAPARWLRQISQLRYDFDNQFPNSRSDFLKMEAYRFICTRKH